MGRLRAFLLRFTVAALIASPLPGPFSASASAAAPVPAVLGVRAADHDGVTRFVLDLSEDVTFKVVTQVAPPEVEIDLPELDWQVGEKGLSRGVGLLRNFSYGTPSPGNGRLVLETGQAVVVRKAFMIPPAAGGRYRLVVDLAGLTTAPVPGEAPKPAPAAARGGNPILAPAAGRLTHVEDSPVASGPVPAAQARPMPSNMPAPIPAALTLPPEAGVAEKPMGRKGPHAGKPIVMIDPGHGGVDPGATSLTGAYEKNIVLALARDVKAQLDKDGKVTCELTRESDIFIPLRQRIAISRAHHADLFMSLHADTVADPDIHGLSVYTLSQNASDAEAQALADKENKADIVAGIDLSNESPEVTNILIDLVQRESMNHSAVFANYLIHEVSTETHELLQNTHRFAGFAVLKAPDVPSVLVETGYLSNEQDEQMLRRPEYRAKLAKALARAIERYFAQPQKSRHH